MFRLVSFLSLRLTPAYPGRKTRARVEAQNILLPRVVSVYVFVIFHQFCAGHTRACPRGRTAPQPHTSLREEPVQMAYAPSLAKRESEPPCAAAVRRHARGWKQTVIVAARRSFISRLSTVYIYLFRNLFTPRSVTQQNMSCLTELIRA